MLHLLSINKATTLGVIPFSQKWVERKRYVVETNKAEMTPTLLMNLTEFLPSTKMTWFSLTIKMWEWWWYPSRYRRYNGVAAYQVYFDDRSYLLHRSELRPMETPYAESLHRRKSVQRIQYYFEGWINSISKSPRVRWHRNSDMEQPSGKRPQKKRGSGAQPTQGVRKRE